MSYRWQGTWYRPCHRASSPRIFFINNLASLTPTQRIIIVIMDRTSEHVFNIGYHVFRAHSLSIARQRTSVNMLKSSTCWNRTFPFTFSLDLPPKASSSKLSCDEWQWNTCPLELFTPYQLRRITTHCNNCNTLQESLWLNVSCDEWQ